MTSRKWGHNSIIPPLKASKVRIQDPFEAEFITQDLPCNFREARILMVLDPLNGSPAKLVVEASNSPHSPWTTAYAPRPMDHRLWCTVHGPWTIGHQKQRKHQKGP
ncbi:hypothetical protein O181_076054 [Austropuccinia psidii MF-1]|uniref:Uncharacterized protein n=1 Tax=Austropuccinia psidii MF-1 TaxID=1389203 RepID=A0A9Q3FBR6_9BASI|nr:hypothetical protein [Austropuccinia psidii MF-1]